MKCEAVKLDDEQVRRFICDGVVVLDSGVAPEVHQQIFDKIQWSQTHEFNMGNNTLPRIAELQQVLDAPVIHGALQSVLGDDYILHPHRALHTSEPLEEAQRDLALKGDEHGPPMGDGSNSNSSWHQDGQIPMSRARYHVPRMAMIIYFPHDTPVERGPTRVIPGTQLQPYLRESDFPFAFVADDVKAGTCLLLAYDIAHAALSNHTDESRYMLKFQFMRMANPIEPSWRGGKNGWQPPQDRMGRFDHNKAWAYIWDWLCGAPRAGTVQASPDNVQGWVGALNTVDQEARLHAIYQLAEAGADAIGPLRESLLQNAGLEREFTCPYHVDQDGAYVPVGDPNERRWNDVAYTLQDEAYALGAMGEVAVQPLVELLKHDDDWIKINAAFALGEIGAPAASAMADLTELLHHELHQVVRVSLDAMAGIGTNTRVALPAIRKLLTVGNPRWQEPMGNRYPETGVRFNALFALLCSDMPMNEIDDLLIACLDDINGYIQVMALEALTRPYRGEERRGLVHALDYLKTHCWDDTLANGKRVF
jgi:hypothetical protein